MAFQLSDGTPIPLDSPFSIGTTNYPANWLRLSTAQEKIDAGIVEVADPTVYDYRFYENNGNPKEINDINTVDQDGNLVKKADGTQHITYGLKTNFKNEEKSIAASLLSKYDWYVVRKAEKGTEIPSAIQTFRDGVRTACDTREKEIDACSDVAALVTLYGATYDSDGKFEKFNMTQYPDDPNRTL